MMNDEYGQPFSDVELVRRSLALEDRSFEELVRRYKQRVIGLVYRYARDSHEAEDMAQETFVKAYFSLKHYRANGAFAGWLLKIAYRVSVDHLRKRRRKNELFFSDMMGPESENQKMDQVSVLETQNSEEAINTRDLERFYLSLLNRFSPEDQFILQAAELEGDSMQEIADKTQKSVASVKVRLFRARNKLRQWLEEIHEAP